ncbi:hypothetical protein E1091_15750 [Micromonospora fluostatini]|uniref:Uncharacterized protein n=1 Tax=Micromonospora fluostatini TaxID=1629071 RepID=A0ABY2DEG1_9ACTN|nr:hypothetical protein E1091_15750 [Micromonospora fluostatini]
MTTAEILAALTSGVRYAAPEILGLLLTVLLVAATLWLGIWWREVRDRLAARWVARRGRVQRRRRAARVAADRTARQRLSAAPGLPPPGRDGWPVATGLLVALVVLVALVAGAARRGSVTPGILAALIVAVLAWVGAVAVTMILADRRARLERYRGLHAVSRPLYDRGECPQVLGMGEPR